MIPDRLIQLVSAAVLAAALTGQLPRFIKAVNIARLELVRDSKASHWGRPFLP
jgi:hypothetical protein